MSVPGTAEEAGPRTFAAVLFDLGGVIADSPFDAFARYEREHRLPDGFIRALNAANPMDNAWARLERNDLDFDAFCDAFEAEASAAGGALDARRLFASFTGDLRPAMVTALSRLRPEFKTGLLTNNFVTPLAAQRPDGFAELLAMFDVIVESSVVGLRKPDERFYLLACDRLGVDPSAAVFLDDLGVNLKPARALGMTTIKVTDTAQALAELGRLVGRSLL